MILYTQKHRIPFQIDESDYEAVSHYVWCVDSRGYPKTTTGKSPTRLQIRLHQFLLGPATDGLKTDHRNRDKLDNRRSNLRFVTATVNVRNVGMPRNNTSGVKGVYWARGTRKWVAQIKVAGRQKNIGSFDSLQAAAAARLTAEDVIWGSTR